MKKIFLTGVYIMLAFLTESFYLWLFPYTGDVGILCWPITIILASLFGYIFFRLLKNNYKNWQAFAIGAVLLLVQSVLQLLTLPQEAYGTPLSQIAEATRAYNKYEKIKYSDYPVFTDAERVVFMYKFKGELPESFIKLTLDSSKVKYDPSGQRTYVIENRNGLRKYDTSKLQIIESDSSTIISEYRTNDTFTYKLYGDFMNMKAGGYDDRIISLLIFEDDLTFHTGIEKLLYSIVKVIK